MNRKAREIALQSTEWLSFAALMERSGQRYRPSDTTPDRWRSNHQIFAITLGNVDHFPSYGLYEVTQQEVWTFAPKPIMATLIAAMGHELSGWQLAAWFASLNGYLKARPIDLLDSEPERVVKAARFSAQGIQHG